MNIVAVSAEPEFLKLEEIMPNSDCWDLSVEIARLQVDGRETTGSVQLSLLAADAKTVRRTISKVMVDAIVTILDDKRHHAGQKMLEHERMANDPHNDLTPTHRENRRHLAEHYRRLESACKQLLADVREVVEDQTT